MKRRKARLWLFGLVLGFMIYSAAWDARAQDVRAEAGEALYRKYCAVCHEAGGGESRAPSRDVLRQLSPERILNTLETGVMQTQGSQRTLEERRALADFLSDKPFGSEPLNPMPRSAFCSGSGDSFRNLLSGSSWMGWGRTLSNARFQPTDAAGITAEDVPRLKLKWAFGYPGDISASAQPVVAGDRVFVGSLGRRAYSLDARTGCIHWMIETESGVRSAVSIGKTAGGFAAYFGDLAANFYAVDAATGKQLWKVKLENSPLARVTGAAQLHNGRLYVPVASGEEAAAVGPEFECCKFRGSLVALDAATGKQIWKTYTIREEPKPRGKNKVGAQLWGPAGVGIWSAPTLDPKRNTIYVGTGNSYAHPVAPASDSIVAFDMKTGRILWFRQVTPNDVWTSACGVGRDPTNCPDTDAPDFDFGSSPILVELKNGKSALIAGQKSGVVYALDPDQRGQILWQQRVGKGGTQGGIEWGLAADDANVYAAVADFVRFPDGTANPNFGGGIAAVDLNAGEKVWSIPALSACGNRRFCSPAQSSAVTAIPGVVFSGSWDGHLRAYSAADGKILWDYDTMQEYTTVNGVSAKGGSLGAAGPAVVGGMLFTNSGYGRFAMPGNVLLAFSVDGK